MTTPKSQQMPPLATVTGVEIVAAGEWDLSTGPATFTKEDLASAIDAAQCPAVGTPIIKIGHVDPRFDGEPAVGRVANMALSSEGNKITGDMAGMPGWLGAVIASAFPSRSIEGNYDFVCQIGHTHPFVIRALALLGVSMPGVGVLNAVDSTVANLEDVAALYGVTSATAVTAAADPGRPWTLEEGQMTTPVFAAGVTTEDVRRAYYASPGVGYNYWITEMQLNPAQLIVCDDSANKVFRVPVNIKGGTVTFGDAVEVQIEYVDAPAAAAPAEPAPGARVTFASAEESRQGIEVMAWSASTQLKNMGPNPSKSAINKMFALPGATKSASKLPHHDVSSGGAVGGPDAGGCSAAIGALNGAHGGLTGVSSGDKQKAYDHLAAHLRALGQEPPAFTGSAAEAGAEASEEGEDAVDAANSGHEALGTTASPASHSHSHQANSSQGGDQTHTHTHSHAGDANHNHAHADAEAGTRKTGGTDVDFTTEQQAALRAKLGLGENDELTAEAVFRLATAPVAAGGRYTPPEGVVVLEQEVWDNALKKIDAAEKFQQRVLRNERDEVIDKAIRDGKFSAARKQHWQRLWDADPEGTREVLAGLTRNVVPVEDIGAATGSADELLEAEYAALFPPSSGNGS